MKFILTIIQIQYQNIPICSSLKIRPVIIKLVILIQQELLAWPTIEISILYGMSIDKIDYN